MRTFLATLIAFSCIGSVAYAQEFPPVYVFTEDDDDSSYACQVSGASIVAAVESEFRQNLIAIASVEQKFSGKSVWAYINVNPIEISGSLCAASYDFQLYQRQPIYDVVKDRNTIANVEHCSLGGIMTGAPSGLQDRINDNLRDFTNQCISAYLKD